MQIIFSFSPNATNLRYTSKTMWIESTDALKIWVIDLTTMCHVCMWSPCAKRYYFQEWRKCYLPSGIFCNFVNIAQINIYDLFVGIFTNGLISDLTLTEWIRWLKNNVVLPYLIFFVTMLIKSSIEQGWPIFFIPRTRINFTHTFFFFLKRLFEKVSH